MTSTHEFYCVCRINNTDMIKISRVMTVYTIKLFDVYVYNSVSYVYNNHIYIDKSIYIIISYRIYVLQARYTEKISNLPAIHLFFTINELDVM